MLITGIACRLTSPTPAAWSGTPSAEALARTETAAEQIQQTNVIELDKTFSAYYLTATLQERTVTPQPQPTAQTSGEGPWLVFTEKEAGMIHAYDMTTKAAIRIQLPPPIYDDLLRGQVPGERLFYLRAGSPLNTDELALYRVDLSSGDVEKITPLLSIDIQRRIVNQTGTRAFETLNTVTRIDGLAWSPTKQHLAFSAALDNNSSDLYLLTASSGKIERLNGLYTHNATPFWAPGGNWLVSQELGESDLQTGLRSENVSGVRVPGYDDQSSLYLPDRESEGEVFVGWLNAQQFISYSQTAQGLQTLRLINVENQEIRILFPGLFGQAAFDQLSGWLAFILNEELALQSGLTAGVYLQIPDHAEYRLIRAGEYKDLICDPGGMFVVKGSSGVFAFSADGDEVTLPGEGNVLMSPLGNWMIAWGDGTDGASGARLYQPPNNRSLQTLTEKSVEGALWQPDSKGFFLMSEGVLYRLEFPGLDMVEIKAGISGMTPLELIWVE